MTKVLVDSSVWISYFRDSNSHPGLDRLILNNQICTNDIILAELLPSLKLKKQNEIIEALLEIDNIPLEIDWQTIIEMQLQNIQNGINRVGIPDLIILENAINNKLILYSEDKHFKLMKNYFDLFWYDG